MAVKKKKASKKKSSARKKTASRAADSHHPEMPVIKDSMKTTTEEKLAAVAWWQTTDYNAGDAARLLGVTPSSLSKWEKGEALSPRNAGRRPRKKSGKRGAQSPAENQAAELSALRKENAELRALTIDLVMENRRLRA